MTGMAEYVEISYLQEYFLIPEFKIVGIDGRYVGYYKCQDCGEYQYVATIGMTPYGLPAGIEWMFVNRHFIRYLSIKIGGRSC